MFAKLKEQKGENNKQIFGLWMRATVTGSNINDIAPILYRPVLHVHFYLIQFSLCVLKKVGTKRCTSMLQLSGYVGNCNL